MIVLDTSAIIAIVAGEAMAEQCADAIAAEQSIIMSAGTLTEAFIVATRQKRLIEVRSLITNSVTQIIDVTPERAGLAAAAYALFGKGFHPASLNFGDCFAYATAKEFNCPLLYIGEDFARTDVMSAIAPPSA
ncbi:type II toxin-antitoxin system VapC family toxin [Neorhizobium galegae]|uniref:type II toxin-antitoxin system VapC family toxin n=1 Tax=Neorhizobium galegae TaxID=399 RepID=UPI0006225111|nr:type II toxin-antitoxin system VapC family toxin [Neorhizobium galegae]MCQ1766330.1 type II toxin-antitoxin system VapC family toxin [Neorhizobium galegae]MCQ1845244.1 type II toxin-antitoxin system VapC family toxin [Neorhizobium galegae]CDZ36568.1 Probable ribonuclease VapC 1 [Neorhizobium galegae bv. officinalis]